MASEAFKSIAAGLEEAIAYQEGRLTEGVTVHTVEVEEVDIKALRGRLGMTQEGFASTFGLNLDTLKQWERGRRSPRGPERTLLRVIDREPDAVRRALAQ
ncbi:helix-turn-helix domain-containing protein [Azospirillum sp. BE72]|uniref:helix-turn-helix domain-containing protein n=1 Tax=Azospirillum sp. BE72 TaxID=2817776 RepID=UPI0028582E41|nr:helix-turn-helix domain-containing protein [Azospirillum sp. BE72]MDR6775538.1 putative transcriptional regulator [Azospirillum sp. BE72]